MVFFYINLDIIVLFLCITVFIIEFNHKLDWNDVKILNFKPRYHKRLILEMLYIKKQTN